MRAALPLLLVALGCVPKGRHEITEVQLDATRSALSARTAQCAQDATATEARLAELEAEIAARQLQLDELVARAAIRDAEIDRLNRERIDLLAGIEVLRAERDGLRAAWPKGRTPPPDAPATEPALVGHALAEVAAMVERGDHAALDETRLLAAQLAVEDAFAPLAAEGRAEVGRRGTATVVRIPTSLLFQEGFTTLSPRGQQIVARMAEAFSTVPGRRVVIEGHTDDTPVHTAEWPSNWERGFSRAIAVLRGLEAAGALATLSAASYAETRPIGLWDEPKEINDRVEIVIDVDPVLIDWFAPTPAEPVPAPEPPPQPEPLPEPAPPP